MQQKFTKNLAIKIFAQVFVLSVVCLAQAEGATASYANMAPLDQYLIPDRNAEIALARSAAPESISGSAEVLVLGHKGYETAIQGTNGFVCIVERSWGEATNAQEFWNPRMRAPHCFNTQAAHSFLPIYRMKTKLVLAGDSRAKIATAIASALDKKELPALEPGAMCYMMSKQQYLNDHVMNWHPHLMFFASGDAAKSWGANLPGSPVMAANDTQERVTIFMVLVGNWSDGTNVPATDAQPMKH